MRGMATLVASLLLLGAGCGRYGPPVRASRTAATAAAPAAAEAPAPADDTRKDETEKTP